MLNRLLALLAKVRTLAMAAKPATPRKPGWFVPLARATPAVFTLISDEKRAAR